jgi:hypothetical protein
MRDFRAARLELYYVHDNIGTDAARLPQKRPLANSFLDAGRDTLLTGIRLKSHLDFLAIAVSAEACVQSRFSPAE